ncbi:MAG: hypothetical protein PGN34_21400 [Methylobacterium frigidaeris]
MPVTIDFHQSVPADDRNGISAVVSLVDASSLYSSKRYRCHLTYLEPSGLPLRLRDNPALSGFTSGNRNIYLNPTFGGDRPIEDRFIHELIHVLHPGLTRSNPVGTHPIVFYETEKRLYEEIGRPFDIQDSVYETDSQVHDRLKAELRPHTVTFALTADDPASSASPRRPALCVHASPVPDHEQQIRTLIWIGVIAFGAAAVLWVNTQKTAVGPGE